MRIRLNFTLEKEHLPHEYRSIFLSFFKTSLATYDSKLVHKYYDSALQKRYTFAVYLPSAQFEKDTIKIPNKKISLIWSSDDIETGVTFYNAFISQKNQAYPLPSKNFMTLKNIRFEKEAVITKETIEVQFIAPLCVREHDKATNKDRYYAFDSEGFEEVLLQSLRMQIENSDIPITTLDTFKIEPIKPKKVIVKHYNQGIEASVGTFRLTGDIQLLTHLYSTGMSARKSSAFGCFNIIK